jgi:hypothetical protein
MTSRNIQPFAGWLTPYKVNRLLDEADQHSALDQKAAINLPAMDRGVLKLNGSFVEYIDRFFSCVATLRWEGSLLL